MSKLKFVFMGVTLKHGYVTPYDYKIAALHLNLPPKKDSYFFREIKFCCRLEMQMDTRKLKPKL